MEKYRVGIVGATGMVGQRFISLLKDHPWFEVNCVAASARSAGKTYREAVGERWAFSWEIPEKVAGMTVVDAADIDEVSKHVDFVFCAVDMKKDEIRALEEAYAKHEIPVVSNNSACRGIEDVPMVVPEINADHLAVIEAQKKRLGTKNGFIAVKPNCSIQSYVPALTPLLDFEPEKVSVCTYQAISGAGKTFKTWPEMVDNVIPYIGGEDEKSEKRAAEAVGACGGWQDCQRDAARHLCAVPACRLLRRPYGGGVRQLQEKADHRADQGTLGELRDGSAAPGAAERAQALPAVF